MYGSVVAMCARCASGNGSTTVCSQRYRACDGRRSGVEAECIDRRRPTELFHAQSSHHSAAPTDTALAGRGRQCYGHCPLFTHPGAGLAFKVGDAKGCAGVVAGGPSVTVAPMLIAVGSTDMVGATGDTYVPPVDESPDPPARFCGCGASGCVNTRTAAVMSAPPPSPAESRVSCFVRIDYL